MEHEHIPAGNRAANIERFLGYQDDYDRYRPQAPALVKELLVRYLGERPRLVADVGCGTGLSTFLWADAADAVVGFEPNPDMRGKAQAKLEELPGAGRNVSFVPGFSNRLPLEDGSVDIVTCSQSFHWMEPASTLTEFARILKPGGVFAAYDCDWPLPLQAGIELIYQKLIDAADRILSQTEEDTQSAAVKYDKEGHLQRIRQSERFRFTKELVFHNEEKCNAERYVGLALSQGGVQSVLKKQPDALNHEIQALQEAADAHFAGQTLSIPVGYRMRLGVK